MEIHGIVHHTSAGTSSATFTLPECQDGDAVFVFVGGGNRTLNYPNGFDYEVYLTGQEAQGAILYKFPVTAVDDSEAVMTIDFDGGDERIITAVSIGNISEWEMIDYYREGTAGGTYSPSTQQLFTQAYRGDVQLVLGFCRNASTPPVSVEHNELYSGLVGSSSYVFAGEAATDYLATEYDYQLPTRSGHVLMGLAVYQTNWTEFETPPPITRLSNYSGSNGTVYYKNDSVTGTGPYREVTSGDFQISMGLAVGGYSGNVAPVTWGSNRSVDIFTGVRTTSWSTAADVLVFAGKPSDAEKNENSTEISNQYEDWWDVEYDIPTGASSGQYAVVLTAVLKKVQFQKSPNTGDKGRPVLDLQSYTRIRPSGGAITYNGSGQPTSVAITRFGSGGALWEQQDSGTPESSPPYVDHVIDITPALRDSSGVWAIHYTQEGPGGGTPVAGTYDGDNNHQIRWGTRLITLSNTDNGGGVEYTIQPPNRRVLRRNSPPIPIAVVTGYGRLKVLTNTADPDSWKFFIPKYGENGGYGRGKIWTGTEWYTPPLS